MKEPSSGSSSTIGFTVGFTILVILAVAVAEHEATLVNTMGIAVVAAGLFLTPWRTVIVAVVATGLALTLVVTLDLDHPWLRVGNVVLASLLGIAASWALDQRVRSINTLRRTQARVFANMPDAVAVLDDSGRLVRSNQALQALVPPAQQGQRLHPAMHHVLADGRDCPGGCALDVPHGVHAEQAIGPVPDETISPNGSPIHIEYTAGRIDDHLTVVTLRDVSDLVAAEEDRRALLEEAAREHEQQHVVQMLGAPGQMDLPTTPGLELDMWSVPAGHGAATGGDLVDVSQLPDGRALVMVVDALGTGVLSVRDAWKVIYASRALMMSGVQLEDLVARTAATLAGDSEPARASLLAAVVDPATGAVELATGGHPPGLLVHSRGTSQWLEAVGRGVGAPQPGSQTVVRTAMEPGDALVVYTDGVVNSTRDMVEGLSVLRASATALRNRPTAGWARGVMDAVLPGGNAKSDATLLVARLAPRQL
ncbi:MAG: SpoIIE family protein phosphatase [Micrococcales bacterium]|nr:SpoIIE family protein phosphatase [Micrococcales bacterium]